MRFMMGQSLHSADLASFTLRRRTLNDSDNLAQVLSSASLHLPLL